MNDQWMDGERGLGQQTTTRVGGHKKEGSRSQVSSGGGALYLTRQN